MTYDFGFSFTDLPQSLLEALSNWDVWCLVRDELCHCSSAADVESVVSDLGLAEASFESWSY